MKVRRVDWYATDWLDGVAALPPDQRGIYDTIINLIYAHATEDGSIELTEHELAVRCCCHWRALKRLLWALETAGKIQVVRQPCGDPAAVLRLVIRVKRCAEELQRARTRVAKASQNGAKGNEIRWLEIATRSGAAIANNHQPSDIQQESPYRDSTRARSTPWRTTDPCRLAA
jgi:hypothetical protein